MDRKDFYFRQKVTEAELDAAFDETEEAIDRVFTDLGIVGVVAGLDVTQQVSPNMTVQVSGPGVAIDQNGSRIAIASTQNVDLSVDESAVATTVITPGNSKILSIFAEFDRALSDPRVDGNAVTIYYERAESFRLNVAQGSEAVTPVAPALRADEILLADVTITYGTTQITNGMISTARREVVFSISDNPRSISAESLADALGQLLGFYNDHASATADRHNATAIDYSGGGAWADGSTNPAATVAAQLTKIIADLAPTTASASGARKIGIEQLAATWQDASTVAAGTLYAVINGIVSTLASTTASGSGARKLGIEALTAWADGTSNGATSIYSRVAAIVTGLASTSGGGSGAAKIGIDAIASWADASAFSAGTLRATVNKIVADLAASTGTAKVGGAAVSSSGLSIAAGTLATQITALLGLSNNGYALQVARMELKYVPTTTRYYDAIAYGKATAVVVGASGLFAYSKNSGNGDWTEATIGGTPTLSAMRYDSTNDLFVAVGSAGAIYTAPPSASLTFTSRTSGTANALTGIFVGGPIRLIAGGASGTITTSPDGVTWTVRTFGSANSAGVLGGSGSLAVASDATNVRTSTDGITWTARSLTSGMTTNAIHYNGTNYIVGQGTNLTTAGRIHTSPDGVTWTLRDSPTDCVLSFASNGALVVAGCADGLIKYSTDSGVTWSTATVPTTPTLSHVRRVEYDSTRGVFFAFGEAGAVLKSLDGIKWVLDRYDSNSGGINASCTGDGQVFALNISGYGAAWYGTGATVIGTAS
jgi:hypothetical protein